SSCGRVAGSPVSSTPYATTSWWGWPSRPRPRRASRGSERRAVIAATALTRRFGGREVVRDVSFTVALGEVVGCLGPNGARKTTIGLDPRQVVDARRLIRSLADDDRAAVLVSTHLLAEASAVCDRVVVIAAGRVVAEERPGAAGDLEARFLRLVGEAELS